MKLRKGEWRYPSAWFAIFGILGFLGFIGVYELFVQGIHNSRFLSNFASFGFFGFYWFGKYRNVKRDERFVLNEKKALAHSACIAGGLTYIAYRVLLGGAGFSFLSIELKYDLFAISINLMIALFVILYGVLLHRYETQ